MKFLKIAIIIIFLPGLYLFCMPRELNVAKFYQILDKNDENANKVVSEEKLNYDLKLLDKCKLGGKGYNSQDCYKSFFEKYASVNGPQKSLEYLHKLISVDTTIIPGCHYIAHGIGAGTLQYYHGDVGKAYSFNVGDIFSNVGSCANGYYHGVAIGMTKSDKTDDDLYNTLKGFCDKRLNPEDLGKESCNHGIGHAVTLYYNHDIVKSEQMCRRLFSDDKDGFFGCFTGLRMEYGIYLDFTGLWTEKGAQGIKDLCKDYALNTPEREACVMEGSGVVRYGEQYVQAAKDCQTLPTETDRKACTKLTIIHAIRLGRSEQVIDICKQMKSIDERVECTAYFANYLSRAVDVNRNSAYLETTTEVCHTLNIFLYPKCIAISYRNPVIPFRSYMDRGIILNFEDIKRLFLFYQAYFKGCTNCEQKQTDNPENILNQM